METKRKAFDAFRHRHLKPMTPEPTGQTPRLRVIPSVRAVLFDIYGTLLLSGSGDVGTLREAARATALADAFRAVDSPVPEPVDAALECFFDAIQRSHDRDRANGVEFPEVDIVQVWRDVTGELVQHEHFADQPWSADRLERLALEYEVRTNPVWPMPAAAECLDALRTDGLRLGIISNAQFFTLPLLESLLGRTVDAMGFDPDLQYCSHAYLRAKPGTDLFQMAVARLARREIEPSQTLYVGNDMLNDIMPAAAVGFRTALFAGDHRSLRLRPGEPRVEGLSADLVLTDLGQLAGCLG